MKLPEDNEKVEALTFFGLLDILNDFERRLRELEGIPKPIKIEVEPCSDNIVIPKREKRK